MWGFLLTNFFQLGQVAQIRGGFVVISFSVLIKRGLELRLCFFEYNVFSHNTPLILSKNQQIRESNLPR